jgi:uncharacterized Zn finger protein (UPF0148 family)
MVIEQKMSWFHCGRCGVLFQADASARGARLCPACGSNPALPKAEVEASASLARLPVKRSTEDLPRQEHAKNYQEAVKGGRRSRSLLPLLVISWLAFIALVVVAGRWFWQEEMAAAERSNNPRASEAGLSPASQAFLEEAFPDCQKVFGYFLAATNAGGWKEYSVGPPSMIGKMERFFSLNPLIRLEAEKLAGIGVGVLDLPNGQKGVEVRWKAADGRLIEAVFLRERGQWRLDWEQYVRYGDYPWGLFLAGSGEPEGEFRLLARQRLAQERSLDSGMSLVFYAPRFGSPEAVGAQSPEFEIDRTSPAGLLLTEAFAARAEGRRPFGSVLPTLDPDGMVRVRVKIRRIDGEEGRRFELLEVAACHWLTSELSGPIFLGDQSSGD